MRLTPIAKSLAALLLLAALGSCAGSPGGGPRSVAPAPGDGPLALRLLTEKKRLIPLLHRHGKLKLWTSNLKLPDLVAENRGPGTVRLRGVEILGETEAGTEVRHSVTEARLVPFVVASSGAVKRVMRSGPREVLQIAFSRVTVKGPEIADRAEIARGQVAIVPLSRLLWIKVVDAGRLVRLRVALSYSVVGAGHILQASLPLALELYRSKGEYDFPLRKRNLLVAALPLNYPQHRAVHSQEFAFDVLRVHLTAEGQLTTTRVTSPERLEDFIIYKDDVLAIGDGVVVAVGDGFPESRMQDPRAYSEGFFQVLMKELVPKIGFANTIAGNYLVIDHGRGEHAFYAHLSQGSLTKRVGDRVTRGELIAKVGNTGHSTQPHLHFQLMDGRDFLTANGLPVMFRNVRAKEMDQNLVDANSLSHSDFLYLPARLSD
jgi:hypothetical protein